MHSYDQPAIVTISEEEINHTNWVNSMLLMRTVLEWVQPSGKASVFDVAVSGGHGTVRKHPGMYMGGIPGDGSGLHIWGC
ncbi:Uncharacterized protein BM_BM17358 [Brugia malayi]|uniref:Uncharacterized protein n=1 Tax=Brugia malayi TaxID=6279 RepID=A0A4E9F415_BRUMA|nr:Uncharacterized protein BM_BM17358 [Brugia malayi]VIO90699.1 Uncharacterized protein BM_BM17358 [Brugia malayi]